MVASIRVLCIVWSPGHKKIALTMEVIKKLQWQTQRKHTGVKPT